MGPIKIFLAAAFSGILIANGGISISSNELIENAIKYDKQIVVYSGEVIGDIMKRGDNAWINVSDSNNAIGVWLPYSETKIIKYAGRYDYKGDTVKIEGIFNKACTEHGGD
ncbi:MAG: DNA-binding protein, partial [Actinobacteria bacterium]|nr:DNA-binding protein [Actinomycetota bacterium]